MSRRRLPPLKSLRAFEAAARHLSFERAGDELAVTPSAVGQQVKALEAWLGLPLFVRLPSKGVALTPVGVRYAASITDMLDRLEEATARALKPEASRTLTVATVPSFASGWLIPRLGSLRERHPDLDVRISVGQGRTDFAREDVDVAIRMGRGFYPGLRTDLLMEETFFAVCSAALVNDPVHPLKEPVDLRYHTLLHEIVDTIPDYITWDKWLSAIGVEGIDTSRGPAFPHTYLTLQAAASGQGVALATNVLIGDYLHAGRLARPFPHEVKGVYQYDVVCPEATAERPSIVAFRNWILDEARAAGQRV
jgi:LysR family transcriptional regulator, glycine cleavage system transcriptional activator